MSIASKIRELGLDKSHDYHRQEIRRQLWLIAVAIENNPRQDNTQENEFFAGLGEKLNNLKRSVLVWENDDAKTKDALLSIIRDLTYAWEVDMYI